MSGTAVHVALTESKIIADFNTLVPSVPPEIRTLPFPSLTAAWSALFVVQLADEKFWGATGLGDIRISMPVGDVHSLIVGRDIEGSG